MSRRFSPEFHEFMREYIPGHSAKEVSEEAFLRMGIEMTPAQVKSYKCNHNLISGTRTGTNKGRRFNKEWTDEIETFILENYKGVGPSRMAEIVNEKFNATFRRTQMKGFYRRHGISSETTGSHSSHNKGKKLEDTVSPEGLEQIRSTQFKKGHVPYVLKDVGTITKRGDGYLWQKVRPGLRGWEMYHKVLWEKENGPLPEGCVLIFLDGNKENVSLDNLKLITRATHLEMIKHHLRTNDRDLTETGSLIAELNTEIFKNRKEEKKDENS